MRGYRKFSIMTLIVVVSASLVLADKVGGSEFITMLQIVGVAFMGANFFDHIGGAK